MRQLATSHPPSIKRSTMMLEMPEAFCEPLLKTPCTPQNAGRAEGFNPCWFSGNTRLTSVVPEIRSYFG
jgi:hypothetical protein